MASGTIKPSIITQTVFLSFSSGTATIASKSGYALVSAYAYDRPTSETSNPYSIISIQELENGNYYARNAETGLTADVRCMLVWAAV